MTTDLTRQRGMRIDVRGVGQRVAGGRRTLHDVSLTIRPGELVTVIGGSGAGKTTLLDAMAGVRPPAEGLVAGDGGRSAPAYVPQDDIVHLELPLRRTLTYAARLRLPATTIAEDIDRAVRDVLLDLDLSERADQRVGTLSGGERKRASIAVELLTRPCVLFLDEPTSGLDPATAAEVMRLLRRFAEGGTTVVLTTHSPSDVGHCDKVAVLVGDGHLAFFGTPPEALTYFAADRVEQIYERLAGEITPEYWGRRFAGTRTSLPEPVAESSVAEPRGIGPVREWWLLTRRSVDSLARNRLTVGILAGSPVMVLAMFAVLFRPGAFSSAHPSPSATVMILFWIAFGGFFFGLTYGLLQICAEVAVLRRERLAGLGVGPYVLSKVAVLLPLLAAVDAAMLGVLRALDRLPAAGWGTYGSLWVTLLLSSAAAFALGLLISAVVTDPSQATLALPMLCFPQVLFVGAILPVPIMAAVGRWLSYGMSNRWAFEALGHTLGVERLWAHGGSSLGPPLLASYGDTFGRSVLLDWAVLGGFSALFLAATCIVVARRT